ncbi:MAG: hypothetical protein IJC46_03305 [Clostridia bacterium]|nr:hypothetical protein [Clostridia bacterium]
MATVINVKKPKYNEVIASPELIAVNGEGVIPYGGGRTGLFLILYSTNGGTVTIKGGGGVFGGGEKTISLEAGENKHLLLEAGCFVQTDGEHKGCVLVTASNCMLGVIELD